MVWTMDPWRELDRMKRELDGILGHRAHFAPRRSFPAINVYEKDEEIIVSAELPGMTKDDVQITFSEGVLRLAGDRKQPAHIKDMTVLRQERPVGRFEKAFELGVKIRADDISATFKNGVMRITLPKAEEARPKQIPITVE